MRVSTQPKKRSAWLAALLSLLLPGLGQLYNRQVRLALVLMVLTLLLSMPARWMIAEAPAESVVPVAAMMIVLGLATSLFAILQAAIRAKRTGAICLTGFNRWFVYVGLIALVAIWGYVAQLLPISSIESYSTPSGGMMPTLLVGDYMYARTRAFGDRAPERGDLAIFRPPGEPDVDFVKRIIGLPGDRIQLRQGRLYLNGGLIERVPVSNIDSESSIPNDPRLDVYRELLPGGVSYLIAEIGDDMGLDNTAEFVVPAEHVFVLGDNRDRSIDSRSGLGFIPSSALRDKPLFIFWSLDRSRIGRMLE
jgi:signal peptidase I